MPKNPENLRTTEFTPLVGSELSQSTYPQAKANKSEILTAAEEVDHAKWIEAGIYAQHLLADQPQELPVAYKRDLYEVVRQGQFSFLNMIERNQALVMSRAQAIHTRNLTMVDKTQEGNIGLIDAIRRFDYTKGNKLSTFAVWSIDGAIKEARDYRDRTIRLPAKLEDSLRDIGTSFKNLQLQLDRDPTDQELAAESGHKISKVEYFKQHCNGIASLESRIDEERALSDYIIDSQQRSVETQVITAIVFDRLWDKVNALTPADKDLITLRYGLMGDKELSLEKTAKILGTNRETARERIKVILGGLKLALQGYDESEDK